MIQLLRIIHAHRYINAGAHWGEARVVCPPAKAGGGAPMTATDLFMTEATCIRSTTTHYWTGPSNKLS